MSCCSCSCSLFGKGKRRLALLIRRSCRFVYCVCVTHSQQPNVIHRMSESIIPPQKESHSLAVPSLPPYIRPGQDGFFCTECPTFTQHTHTIRPLLPRNCLSRLSLFCSAPSSFSFSRHHRDPKFVCGILQTKEGEKEEGERMGISGRSRDAAATRYRCKCVCCLCWTALSVCVVSALSKSGLSPSPPPLFSFSSKCLSIPRGRLSFARLERERELKNSSLLSLQLLSLLPPLLCLCNEKGSCSVQSTHIVRSLSPLLCLGSKKSSFLLLLIAAMSHNM